jgi:glycosyltransferase involved in cell wall biosynthesis
LPESDRCTISVIVPVFNGARTLPSVLTALACARPAPDEIVVVDDGSTDDSGVLAAKSGCKVIRLDTNVGAARAKNRGAAEARGDILFFTDSDIQVSTDIFARLTKAFSATGLDAVVGLLDPDIPEHNFASQFKNLWMNFTYARFERFERIGLFYTSAAAIRRERFFELGGFDENYRGASIAEDTEFGQRGWALGAIIQLDPAVRVVHLKKYALRGVLSEDFRRAAALTRMRLRKWKQPFFTSVPTFYQLGVPSVYLAVAGIVLAGLAQNLEWLILAFAAFATFYLLNSRFVTYLARLRGNRFALLSCIFLPVDAFVVGLGILFAVIDFLRGRLY